MYRIQSVIFSRNAFSVREARKWLKHYGLLWNGKVDRKEHHIRFRQIEPEDLAHEGFNRYRTLVIAPTVSFVVAYKGK